MFVIFEWKIHIIIIDLLFFISQVYWKLGEDGKVPSTWPDSLSTKINIDNPMNFTNMDNKYKLFIAVSIV